MAEASDLPDECWESIFKILKDDENDKHHLHFKSLSRVSNKFLSITSSLQSSLNVYNPTRFFLPAFLKRFTNLTSLNFTCFHDDLNEFLHQLSRFPSNITSLNLSHKPVIPADGLKAFSQNNKTLTSLKCSDVKFIDSYDLLLIADCFPLLEELDLSGDHQFSICNNLHNGIATLSMKLFKLRKINLSRHSYMNDILLYRLFKNCKLLQEAIIFDCYSVSIAGITLALGERPTLRSLSFTHDSENFTNLFALVTNHPSLSYITMEYKRRWRMSMQNSNTLMDYVVSPQVKSLCLVRNTWLSDENVVTLASIFPNLQLLDLSYCDKISDGICHVLNMCCKIRHLNLAHCSRVKLLGINFEAPKLEMLNLSHTRVKDETLGVISKNCRGLLQLFLEKCVYVTNIGVNHVVENCTQLREINLKKCCRVNSKVVASMISSRPSLKKIHVPPSYGFNNKEERDFWWSHRGLLC
ncbi:uncharacterized protein LOC131626682 [Vicia villosa]|uniref:uncharacterized protein LOC131626682 n=1 Tax=Vicia villosa TaxID=3911 RepID=UPI00273B7F73|nr:uncharacterized protein LOC131626682 [Vicia villosa]